METAKIFMNGRSQAVRLPKRFRFTCNEVYIRREGDTVVLIPKASKWDDFFLSDDVVGDDFLSERWMG